MKRDMWSIIAFGALAWIALKMIGATQGKSFAEHATEAFFGQLPGGFEAKESGASSTFPREWNGQAMDGMIQRVQNRIASNDIEFIVVNHSNTPREFTAYVSFRAVAAGIPPVVWDKTGLVKGRLAAGTWQRFIATVTGSLDVATFGVARLFVNGANVHSI